MRIMIFALGLCLLLVGSLAAETSVWVVNTDSSTLYLGGTVHILREGDYPLPTEYDSAFADADKLVFEVDFEKMNSPEMQQLVLAKGMFTDGTTLKDVLSEEIFQRLEAYCAERNIPLANMMTFKPWLIMITLVTVEVQRLGGTGAGVDMYYFGQGKEAGKSLGWLETAEEQFDVLMKISEGNEDQFLMYFFEDVEQMQETYEQMIASWRAGDVDGLYELFMAEMVKEHPDFYEALFVKRNNNWMPQVVEMLKTPETELVLVGAGHLVGEDGLIEQLEELGYEVEQVE